MAQDLQQILGGKSLMVIVPHEDDEINLAGASIYGAVEAGMRVICVFMTNGDWFYPGGVRMKEAVRSLRCLGVPEENIVFLGYPDGGVQGERNVYVCGQSEPVRAGRHRETYGMASHPEFAWQAYGRHQPYLWNSLLQDMETVLLKYRADILMAADLDWHPDHRLCSMAFETALGRILNRPGNTYRPKVLKGFAYRTAYESADDFNALNLRSTVCCYGSGETARGQGTDNPSLPWENRIRLPVPASCRSRLLRKNPLYRAMCCHASQRMFGRAEKIINGDQVFWLRRTDSLSFVGRWTSSSGDTAGLHDFQVLRPQDITAVSSEMTGRCWRPGPGKAPWCRCTFSASRCVSHMVFHGNPEKSGRILAGEVRFSTGAVYPVGPIPWGGAPAAVSFPAQEVEWVEFRVLRTEGTQAGLAEWEIFEQPDSGLRILQILCDDQFTCDWCADRRRPPVISAYRVGMDNALRWYWNGAPCRLTEIQQRCAALRSPAVVRVEWEKEPRISSEVQIRPRDWKAGAACRWRTIQNRMTQWVERRREKPAHHRAKKLAQKKRRGNG